MDKVENKTFIKALIVDLALQYKTIRHEIEDAVKKVLASGNYILGPNVEAFERELAEYLGVKYVVSCANGTDAIVLALKTLNIKEGDEVITVSHSYFATSEAIALVGAKPVFVDIQETDFNIDPSLIERSITKKTKAIVPVHLYGQPCKIEEVINIAKKHGLYVVEDCAQALGAKCNNKFTGTFGDVATTSFYPTKNLGAYGDGGAIFTNNSEIAGKLKLLRMHGSTRRYVHDLIGQNSRLDELQAAILRVKLKYLDEWNTQRRKAADYYSLYLSNVPGLITPYINPTCTHIFHQYTIRVRNRDILCEKLKERGIDTLIYYPIPIHLQKAFSDLGLKNCKLPVTERICNEILSLPMYPEITRENQEYVSKNIKEILGNQS